MNDLEQELRELLETKSRESRVAPPAPKRVLRRARRRQVRTGAIALFAAAAVVVGAIAGLGALRVDRGRQTPANRPIELPVAPTGFRSAALPYASIAYPDGWYLMDTSPLVSYGIARPESLGSDPVLQLANFDSNLRISPRCMVDPDALPDGGVLLTVGVLDPADTSIAEPMSAWPVQLTRDTKDDPVCPSDLWEASWTTPSGMRYWAGALYSRDAPDRDRALLEEAFASLTFPPTEEPQMTRMAAFQSQGTPRLVLDSALVDGDPYTLVAYLELGKSLWVGVSSPTSGRGRGGGAIGVDTGSQPSEEPVSTTIDGAGTPSSVVYGTVQPEVARVEIRTDEGRTFPATIVPFPASLGRTDRAVWGFVEGQTQYAQGVAYDAKGNLLWPTDLPTAPPTELATGVDPIGGPWTLAIIHSTDGDGLSFEFEEHGGGSGCCLQPLGDSDLRLDGWGTTGGAPSNITAFVSTRVARVEVAMDSGETFEGRLFPMPEKYIGQAQVALVFVPEEVAIQGHVVAYDAQGNELAREAVGDVPEPSGPTAEIDAVWQALYKARDSVHRFLVGYDSLLAFTPERAGQVEPKVAWNDAHVAVAYEVSIRGAQTDRLALVSATPSGDAYCIAVYVDENGGGSYRYGMVDAATYDDCRGGWE